MVACILNCSVTLIATIYLLMINVLKIMIIVCFLYYTMKRKSDVCVIYETGEANLNMNE